MFIIIGLSDTDAQVLDTLDGVVESLSKREVFELSKKVTIQGVPKTSIGEWVSKDIKRVISILVSNNRVKEAIVSLPEGYKIELTLQSRPNSRILEPASVKISFTSCCNRMRASISTCRCCK